MSTASNLIRAEIATTRKRLKEYEVDRNRLEKDASIMDSKIRKLSKRIQALEQAHELITPTKLKGKS